MWKIVTVGNGRVFLTGSDLGNIYLWKREEQIDMIVSAHKSSVYALATFVNGFVSGGKDGKIRVIALIL